MGVIKDKVYFSLSKEEMRFVSNIAKQVSISTEEVAKMFVYECFKDIELMNKKLALYQIAYDFNFK